MSGKLILVSGLSGSGKTTLIGGALKLLRKLVYLKTYTTRPMRDGEEGSHEYIFVDQAEYNMLRTSSIEWDHTEYSGFMYGADAAEAKTRLAAGTSVICSVTPDYADIEAMTKIYGPATTIWIKVPKEVAKQRIYEDDIRDSRNEDFALSSNFDIIFEPIGQIEPDVQAFSELIHDVSNEEQIGS